MQQRYFTVLCMILVLVRAEQKCEPPVNRVLQVYAGLSNNITLLDGAKRSESSSLDWGNLLSPAPAAIGTIASLMLITAERDVTLNDSPPEGGWKYVRWPNSLRATLLQVANAGHGALDLAHHNMATIKIKTGHAQGYFRDIVQILTRGTAIERKHTMPHAIRRLAAIAPSCAELAKQTSARFRDVSSLIEELLEACTDTHSLRNSERRKAEALKKELTAANATLNAHLEQVKADVAKSEKHMDEARELLKKSIKDKPGFWDYMGAALADMVSSINPMDILKYLGSGDKSGGGSSGSYSDSDAKSYIEKFVEIGAIYKTYLESQVKVPLEIIESLEQPDGDIQGDITEAMQQFTEGRSKLNAILAAAAALHPKIGEISETMSELVEEAQRILRETQEHVTGTISLNGESINLLKEDATEWQGKALKFDQKIKKIVGDSKNKPVGPGAAVAAKGSTKAVEALGSNYQVQIAAGQKMYATELEKWKFQLTRLDALNAESRTILRDLMRVDLTVVDLTDAIETLRKALDQVGKLQTQWLKLTEFFNNIERIISNDWYEKTTKFLDYVKGYVNVTATRIPFGTDSLYRVAFEATRMNYRIHKMADTYETVSSEHFMPPLRNMSLLLSITDKAGLIAAQQSILNQLVNAQQGIRAILIRDKEELDASMAEYQRQLHESYQLLCPSTDTTVFTEQVDEAVDEATEETKDVKDPIDELDDLGIPFF